jgi:hypothetical protein
MSERRAPFLSVPHCLGLAGAAGMLGLVLIRVVPVSADNAYLARYATWAREVNALFEACGKHEPRDPECVRLHPIRDKP